MATCPVCGEKKDLFLAAAENHLLFNGKIIKKEQVVIKVCAQCKAKRIS